MGLFVLLGYGDFEERFLACPSDVSTREPRGDSNTHQNRLMMAKSGFQKQHASFCSAEGWPPSLFGHFCFEWVTNRRWCLPEERRTVSPRCGLFTFCYLIRASVHSSLHKPPKRKQQHPRPGCLLIPWNEKINQMQNLKKKRIIIDLNRLSLPCLIVNH